LVAESVDCDILVRVRYLRLMTEGLNVTLGLPRRLLKRVKRLAAERETPVSALMTEALEHWRTKTPATLRRESAPWPQ